MDALKTTKVEFFGDNHRGTVANEKATLWSSLAHEFFVEECNRVGEEREVLAWTAREKVSKYEAVSGYKLVFAPQRSVTVWWGLGGDHARKTIGRVHAEAAHSQLAYLNSRLLLFDRVTRVRAR